jgi:hypothetical protein
MKTLTSDQFIPYELLKEYLSRRIKSKLMSETLTSISLDYIEQYFVQDGRVNRYEISTAIILYSCKVPLEEDIEDYKHKLL